MKTSPPSQLTETRAVQDVLDAACTVESLQCGVPLDRSDRHVQERASELILLSGENVKESDRSE